MSGQQSAIELLRGRLDGYNLDLAKAGKGLVRALVRLGLDPTGAMFLSALPGELASLADAVEKRETDKAVHRTRLAAAMVASSSEAQAGAEAVRKILDDPAMVDALHSRFVVAEQLLPPRSPSEKVRLVAAAMVSGSLADGADGVDVWVAHWLSQRSMHQIWFWADVAREVFGDDPVAYRECKPDQPYPYREFVEAATAMVRQLERHAWTNAGKDASVQQGLGNFGTPGWAFTGAKGGYLYTKSTGSSQHMNPTAMFVRLHNVFAQQVQVRSFLERQDAEVRAAVEATRPTRNS